MKSFVLNKIMGANGNRKQEDKVVQKGQGQELGKGQGQDLGQKRGQGQDRGQGARLVRRDGTNVK